VSADSSPYVVSGGRTRPAAVAGAFYPAEPGRLRAGVQALLHAAQDAPLGRARVKALIVPHAGYVYSGETAARGYARLAGQRGTIRRVVLLGPAHRVHVRGLALPEADFFETPLGSLEVDGDAVRELSALRQVVAARPVHAAEHALEVHLPFLIETLGHFKLVPLVVGEATPAMVAEVLDLLWGGAETLIVVSSDLSHYHPYREAVRIDNATVASILACDSRINHEQACGATPINGLLQVARRRGLSVELVDQCNSGDTAGSRDRVVGYAAFAIAETRSGIAAAPNDAAQTVVPQWFPADGAAVLVRLARNSIARALGLPAAPAESAPWLANPAAVFVTLTRGAALRGCIGSLEAYRALGTDVAENAMAAALRDPRFAPLTAEELSSIHVEVSLLTAPEALHFDDEASLLGQLMPHQDGLIFEAAGRRSTFLPQVWEQIPEPRAFLAALKRKAGLDADYWDAGVRVSRYRVAKFSE
jgi:hypothetical protein